MAKKMHNRIPGKPRLSRLQFKGPDGKIHIRINRELKPYQWWLLPFGPEREAARKVFMHE